MVAQEEPASFAAPFFYPTSLHYCAGGVAVLVKKDLGSQNAYSLDTDLEMLSINVKWANEPGCITCVYKDHSMPKPLFINKMKKVFESSLAKPSIIAGDFNLHDDTNKYNGLLNSYALENNFIHLVNESTTINGHILDQIFVNDENYLNSYKIINLPSYFSDHNLIVLCIKKEK